MSLIENFKDRVPTEVLPNGAIRYEQFDSNGNSLGYVYMLRADEPTEVGNIWNKSTYDGIKEELATKLNISSKANQSEAETGTDDTKYMTPLKTSQAIKQLCDVRTYDLEFNNAKHYFSDYITTNTRFIEVNCSVERYDNSSNLTSWEYGSASSLKGIISNFTSQSITDSPLHKSNRYELGSRQIDDVFNLFIDVKTKKVYIEKDMGTISNNNYSCYLVNAFFDGADLGYLYARKVREGYAGNLKMKVYDSPKMTE